MADLEADLAPVDVEFRQRERGRATGRPTFSWAGALRDLRDEYTSVE